MSALVGIRTRAMEQCAVAVWLSACLFISSGCLPPPDDVPEVDAAPAIDAVVDGEITIVVADEGVPEVGVPVLFHDDTGAWTATERTDETGRVVRVVAAGAVVTVITGGEGSGRHRTTWEALGPVPLNADAYLLHEDNWVLVVPPDATQVVYPELPDEFAELRSRFRPSGSVELFDVDSIHSYRDFRSGKSKARDWGNSYSTPWISPEQSAPPLGERWTWSYAWRPLD